MPPDLEAQALAEVKRILSPLENYSVEAVLGTGAMGYVVLVRDKELKRRVAMKLINPALQASELIFRRFKNEAAIMGALQHPHVVTVHRFGKASGISYIEMEFLEGGTLADHLDEFGEMPERQAVDIIVCVLSALEAAHTYADDQEQPWPIIHRDIKLENVLLTKTGISKVADFGIAHLEGGTRQLTRAGSIMGTLVYMSPEQRAGVKIDARSDLYSVGVLLYVLIKAPENYWKVCFHEALNKHPEMLRGVSPELAQFIISSTSEKPEDRFASAEAMACALRAIIPALRESETLHKLGSAPKVARARKLAESGEQMGASALQGTSGTMIPDASGEPRQSSRVSHHSQASASQGALVSHESDEGKRGLLVGSGNERSRSPGGMAELPGGTLHGSLQSQTAFERDVHRTHEGAKRRFFMGLGGISAMLVIVGVSIGYVKNLDDEVVEPLPVVAEVQPETTGSEVIPTVAATQIEAVEADPVSIPVTPAPPKKIEKKAPKAVASVDAGAPPPEATPVSEKAQVRMILKEETIATITLTGESGTFTVSPANTSITLPPGTYKASVQMDGRDGAPQTGTLTVNPGITTITCTARFKKCTGLK